MFCDCGAEFTPAPGACINIDGEWWHEPGSCHYCRCQRCAEIEERIADDAARREAARAVCTVCQREPVDAMSGEDTCEHCLRRMRHA